MAYVPNYTPDQLPEVATDVLGTVGIGFKVYMPLLVMALVFGILATIWVKIKRAGRA